MKSQLNLLKIISNIFLFLLIASLISNFMIGGDALSGKIENNKYFVWDAIRKRNKNGDTLYLEVSKAVYMFNLGLNYLLFLMMPIFLFFKIKEYLYNKKRKV
jgi:hypothetical protein